MARRRMKISLGIIRVLCSTLVQKSLGAWESLLGVLARPAKPRRKKV